MYHAEGGRVKGKKNKRKLRQRVATGWEGCIIGACERGNGADTARLPATTPKAKESQMGRAKTSQFGTTTYQQAMARATAVLDAAADKHSGKAGHWIRLLLTVLEGPMGGGALKSEEYTEALFELDALLIEWGVPFEGKGPLRDMGAVMRADAKAAAEVKAKKEEKSAAERAAAGIE